MAEPTLFDEASLALIASGGAGKDGKVYSIKPVPEYGPELVTNGDFATDSNWNKGSGWTISGGTANCTGTGGSILRQTNAVPLNTKFYVSIEVKNYVSGTLQVKFAPTQQNLNVTGNGIYTVLTAGDNNVNQDIQIISSNFVGSVDNVSVKKVLASDGDFTFSRGSNLAATRVGPDGLIEKGRENLLLQSNQFDTTWVQSSATLTSGQSGYDGSSDAWLLTKNASFGRLDQTISSSGVQTYSVYAKANDSDWIYFRADYSGGVASGYFDLVNGVGGSFGNIIDSDITSVGGGWYRIQIVFNATTTIVRIYPAEDNNQSGGTSGSIYIQDSQLEIGLAATEVISSGASTGKAGLLEDEPRFDYSGGATCPSLLLEPSRTNLITQSEYFSDSYWTKQGATLTDNAAISPEGVNNSTKLVETATTERHRVYGYGAFTSGTNYTLSVFVKKNSSNRFLLLNANTAFNARAALNLDTLEITNINGTNGKVEDYSNGWYRFSISGQSTTSSSHSIFVQLQNAATDSTYLGNGSSLYLFGAQCEAGSYATSYIPTYGSSQTRAGEACYLQDTNVHSNNAGTIFFEVGDYDTNTSASGFNKIFVFDEVATSNLDNVIYFEEYAGNNTILVRKGGSTLLQSTPNYQDLRGSKIAIKWSHEGAKMFINGALNRTYTGDASLNIQYFGFDNPYNGDIVSTIKMKQLLGFPTALSDTELIKLTTI